MNKILLSLKTLAINLELWLPTFFERDYDFLQTFHRIGAIMTAAALAVVIEAGYRVPRNKVNQKYAFQPAK